MNLYLKILNRKIEDMNLYWQQGTTGQPTTPKFIDP